MWVTDWKRHVAGAFFVALAGGLLALGFVPDAAAAKLAGITVPVASTSLDDRNRAFTQALAKVPGGAAIDPADAASYVRSYQYHRAPEGAAEPFTLTVHFAATALGIHRQPETGVAALSGDTAQALPPAIAKLATAPVADYQLTVSGMRSGVVFLHMLDVLRGLPGVRRATVTAARGDAVLLDMQAPVPRQLLAALVASGHFVAAPMPSPFGTGESILWRG